MKDLINNGKNEQNRPGLEENSNEKGRVMSYDDLKAENEALQIKFGELERKYEMNISLLRSISREIRTPLNTLKGFCSFLSDPSLTAEKRSAFIKIINESSDQLLSIITDILNIAVPGDNGNDVLQKDSFDLNRLMDQLFEEYSVRAREQSNSFKMKKGLGGEKARIISDRSKLTRILANLLINAIKFTGQGKVRFGYNLEESDLLFYVKDTGIGIPVELQKVIFKRFESGEVSDNHYYCESSLGLSISNAYIEMLGGKIWVDSTPGLGSSFFFTIPYIRA